MYAIQKLNNKDLQQELVATPKERVDDLEDTQQAHLWGSA